MLKQSPSVHHRLQVICLLVGLSVLLGGNAIAAEKPAAAPQKAEFKAPGLGDPGQFEAIVIESARATDGTILLSGQSSQQQLIVTGKYSSGQTRDWSRKVAYQATKPNIVSIDSSGLMTPREEGTTIVIAKTKDGKSAKILVMVKDLTREIPVNFPNQVVPIFSKLGCNSGGCHGKASGQNGFRLSLLGFEPPEDYEHLLKEGRGRRLFPAAPDQSLLLLKATNKVAHGGGEKIKVGTYNYRIIRQWIKQGMPYTSPGDRSIVRIETFPKQQRMERGGEQQITVTAYYSDGSSEDVTHVTQFEPNDTEMAEISASGLVKTADLTGDVAVMARFMGQVGVFRATIPLGIAVTNLPKANNFVDELVFKKLDSLGLPPSELCDDSTFIRRVTIDIAGRLPTMEETREFLANKNADKRSKWINYLLDSTDYADYFANKWSAVLRNKRVKEEDRHGTYAFHAWIRESLYKNKPYDQFVREILAASGDVADNPPVIWYRQVKTSTQQLEDTSQLFLGMRIQCARCHHHPFEKWSQNDYYSFQAFFSRVGQKNGSSPSEKRIFHNRGIAKARNPKTSLDVKPAGLGGGALDIEEGDDPRHALVDWMVREDNPFFAYSLANRYWKHFFSRGLVDPEDDMRVTNPASNPELLSALGKHFIAHKFDLKDLVRTICNSNTYQLSALPNQYNEKDKQNYSRYYPKRLNAEVLLDAIDTLTKSTTRFGGMPSGTRAVQLPDNNFSSYFLTVFGRPESTSACECERSADANLAQSLHLLNSGDVQNKIAAGSGRAATLTSDKARTIEDKLQELYLVALSRLPDKSEIAIAKDYVSKAKTDADRKKAYEDLIWVLVNTKEFQFNH